MRDDFKKVLCEEPRVGSKGARALNKLPGYKKKAQKARRGDYDEWNFPRTESMRARGTWSSRGDKWFGEHLGPLVRFLRSSVGRKWDDVYSEIAKSCPNNGAVTGHIYEHLWSYVERNPEFIDGKPYDPTYGYRGKIYPIEDRGSDNTFYVDPDGFLRRAPRLKQKSKKEIKTIHKVKGKIYLKFEGIWYQALTRPIPKKQAEYIEHTDAKGRVRKMEVMRRPTFSDIYIGSIWSWWYQPQRMEQMAKRCFQVYGKKVYCYDKRQLSSKELRRLGLKNNEKKK